MSSTRCLSVFLLVVAFPTCSAYYTCSSSDWSSITTPCDSGSRQVLYEWISPKVCVNGDPLPAAQTLNNCGDTSCWFGTCHCILTC